MVYFIACYEPILVYHNLKGPFKKGTFYELYIPPGQALTEASKGRALILNCQYK